MICIFFGHRDCYDLEEKKLQHAVEKLISEGVNTFYVGHQGHFDGMVFECLSKFKEKDPSLSLFVVLARFPTQQVNDLYQGYTLYPEGLETAPAKFAIDRRNKWMIGQADYCLCCIDHTWGGAYKFAMQAKRRGVIVINLGNAQI